MGQTGSVHRHAGVPEHLWHHLLPLAPTAMLGSWSLNCLSEGTVAPKAPRGLVAAYSGRLPVRNQVKARAPGAAAVPAAAFYDPL